MFNQVQSKSRPEQAGVYASDIPVIFRFNSPTIVVACRVCGPMPPAIRAMPKVSQAMIGSWA
jgi:hypothetical protein